MFAITDPGSFELHSWHWPLLLVVGWFAGFVDSIAGGGGLITLPVLLGLGLPPQTALGTNKLQSSFGSGSAAWHYGSAGLIDWKEWQTSLILTFIGAAAGSILVQQMRPDFLRQIIPWLLAAILIYTILRPRFGIYDHPQTVPTTLFGATFGLGIGFYDGFFGPGTGTFFAMACVGLLGYNLTKATAHTKALNFASNLAALLCFATGSHVLFGAGLIMGCGQLLGARTGALLAVKKGAGFIRPAFLAVVTVITARLFWTTYGR